MVERTIGAKPGTGGSAGAAYLRTTLGPADLFPTCGRSERSCDAARRARRISAPRHYSRFRVAERLLLTGHSHQAWPDVAFEAQQRAWLDAAEFVDDKWDARGGAGRSSCARASRRLLGDPPATSRSARTRTSWSTRLLSALPLGRRARRSSPPTASFTRSGGSSTGSPKRASTSSRSPAQPVGDARRAAGRRRRRSRRVRARLVGAVSRPRRSCPASATLAAALRAHGATLLVDAYHHLNVVPFDVRRSGLERRVRDRRRLQVLPARRRQRVSSRARRLRAAAGADRMVQRVRRARAGATRRTASATAAAPARFAGATYDPTSHYRAAAVFEFHRAAGTDAGAAARDQPASDALLASGSTLSTSIRTATLVEVSPQRRAGFVAIRMPDADGMVESAREHADVSSTRG